MEFMPQNAPLVVLTFLGTCFALGVLGIAIVYGLVRGSLRWSSTPWPRRLPAPAFTPVCC